jgi:putative glycosyltransferase (TIGR04348 family)
MGSRPVVCIVTPGTRDANNGNWRTAARWARMLRDRYRIIVQTAWDGERADAMVALHARRSASSIAAFASATRGPIGVVLTGTDLYRDLGKIADTARSLDVARRIVVLQEDARRLLTPAWRRKAEVIFQSAPRIAHVRARNDFLRCVVVGHLREEKDPLTVIRAVERLPSDLAIRVRQIGAPLDPELGRAAVAFAKREARYVYSGALSHGLTRAALASADLLIHPSIMEGGANVIVEAVTSGTPVVASRISGNIGMLGAKYPGYFERGEAESLAALLRRCAGDPPFLKQLKTACDRRAPLFRPAVESRAVHRFVAGLLV